VDQEESILLLFPDAPYEHLKEILFLKETNEHIAIWEHSISRNYSKIKSFMNYDIILITISYKHKTRTVLERI
jgi:hypothetical protein